MTAVDGEPISSADGLIIALREHEVGDKVTLTVMRGKDEKEIEVELGSDEALQAEQQDASDGNGSSGGMTEEEFLRYLEQYMGGRGGSSACPPVWPSWRCDTVVPQWRVRSNWRRARFCIEGDGRTGNGNGGRRRRSRRAGLAHIDASANLRRLALYG